MFVYIHNLFGILVVWLILCIHYSSKCFELSPTLFVLIWFSQLIEPKGQLISIDGKTNDEVCRGLERMLLKMEITTSKLKVLHIHSSYIKLGYTDWRTLLKDCTFSRLFWVFFLLRFTSKNISFFSVELFLSLMS